MSDSAVVARLTKHLCSQGGRLERDRLEGLLNIEDVYIERTLEKEPIRFPQISQLVLIQSPLRICDGYLRSDHPEEEENCPKLHLCRYYLRGQCPPYRRSHCRLSHNVLSDHNLAVLQANELSDLNEDEIKVLLFQNDNQLLPLDCPNYMHGSCDKGEDCTRLHVCRYFTQGTCNHRVCKRSHNLLASEIILNCGWMSHKAIQNLQMLCDLKHKERHQDKAREGPYIRRRSTSRPGSQYRGGQRYRDYDDSSSDDSSSDNYATHPEKSKDHVMSPTYTTSQLKSILKKPSKIPATPSTTVVTSPTWSSVEAEARHRSREDTQGLEGKRRERNIDASPDKTPEICLSNIWKFCKLGDKCAAMHYYLPYRWQEFSGTNWEELPNMEKIEKAYSDPSTVGYQSIDFQTMKLGTRRVRRLTTPSSVTKPSEYVLTTEWIWYWKDEFGTWTKYGQLNTKNVSSSIGSSDLENIYLCNPTGTIQFSAANQNYTINCQEMKQKNSYYKTEKEVRRRPAFLDFERVKVLKGSTKSAAGSLTQKSSDHLLKTVTYPAQWDLKAIPEIGYRKVLVVEKSGEFSNIVKMFCKTVSGYVVKRLWSVQNPSLWQVYQWQKDHMKKKLGVNVDERQLFHGTHSVNIDAICRENFDWRICGTNATAYGQGSYFARDAAYSHDYTQPTSAGTRTMFVARVLVGEFAVGDSTMRRPPQKYNKTERYDSCVNNIHNPSIFVVFDRLQVYPEYILEYEEKNVYPQYFVEYEEEKKSSCVIS